MADLNRAFTTATETLADAKASGGAPASTGAEDGQTRARGARQLQQQLQQQVTQLQQQVTQLRPQQVTVEQPSLTAEAVASAISSAVSAYTFPSSKKEADDTPQMSLTGSADPKTMADKVLNASVNEARAQAKVQPLLNHTC